MVQSLEVYLENQKEGHLVSRMESLMGFGKECH